MAEWQEILIFLEFYKSQLPGLFYKNFLESPGTQRPQGVTQRSELSKNFKGVAQRSELSNNFSRLLQVPKALIFKQFF